MEDWSVRAIRNEFNNTKNEIHKIAEVEKEKIDKGEAVKSFFGRISYAVKLAFLEKEIIVFALLQWAAIGLGYYLWVQMLGWIPAEVWKSAAESKSGSIADIVLLLWSFVCVGIVAFPLSILSGCMGAVHFIRKREKSSSIASCLKTVMPRAWSLWIFHWIDGWITVNQILERLPKKRDRRTPAQKALSEALYYAWKLGTIGILPSLVTGHNIFESCKHSISIVRHKFKEVATLRIGYSALCWVIGIAAYIGTIFFFIVFHNLVPWGKEEIYGHVYTFYFWAGVPILIAVGVIQLFLRPIYVISACDIYSDYVKEIGEEDVLPQQPSRFVSALVAFLVLCILLLVVFIYRYKLGIMDMLSTKYGDVYIPK